MAPKRLGLCILHDETPENPFGEVEREYLCRGLCCWLSGGDFLNGGTDPANDRSVNGPDTFRVNGSADLADGSDLPPANTSGYRSISIFESSCVSGGQLRANSL